MASEDVPRWLTAEYRRHLKAQAKLSAEFRLRLLVTLTATGLAKVAGKPMRQSRWTAWLRERDQHWRYSGYSEREREAMAVDAFNRALNTAAMRAIDGMAYQRAERGGFY